MRLLLLLPLLLVLRLVSLPLSILLLIECFARVSWIVLVNLHQSSSLFTYNLVTVEILTIEIPFSVRRQVLFVSRFANIVTRSVDLKVRVLLDRVKSFTLSLCSVCIAHGRLNDLISMILVVRLVFLIASCRLTLQAVNSFLGEVMGAFERIVTVLGLFSFCHAGLLSFGLLFALVSLLEHHPFATAIDLLLAFSVGLLLLLLFGSQSGELLLSSLLQSPLVHGTAH